MYIEADKYMYMYVDNIQLTLKIIMHVDEADKLTIIILYNIFCYRHIYMYMQLYLV